MTATTETRDFPVKKASAAVIMGVPFSGKEPIRLPWIQCLYCNCKEKIEFDLSLHFLEEHTEELLAIPITRRERLAAKALSGHPFAFLESPIEYRLDKAVRIAKERGKGDLSNAG